MEYLCKTKHGEPIEEIHLYQKQVVMGTEAFYENVGQGLYYNT